jgi:hypothetical protein
MEGDILPNVRDDTEREGKATWTRNTLKKTSWLILWVVNK